MKYKISMRTMKNKQGRRRLIHTNNAFLLKIAVLARRGRADLPEESEATRRAMANMAGSD